MKKHNILLITQEYAEHDAGGAGVSAREMAEALAALGVSVHVLAPGRQNRREVVRPNLTLHYRKVIYKPLLQVPSFHWQVLRQARRLVRDEQIDTIHSNNFAGLTAMYLRPTVATIHHPIRAELRLSTAKQFFIMLPDAVLEMFVIRFAAKLTTPSHMVADLVADMSKGAAAKTKVICNGVGEIFLKPVSGRKLAGELRQRPRQLLLFFPGGARAKRKGGLTLLNALSKLDRQIDYRCIVSGHSREAGWDTELRQAIKRYKLTRRIKFIGELAYDDLPRYYAAADIVVYPSTFEGFGLPIVEAMAVGTPIITTDTGEAPYIIDNQKNGTILAVDEVQALRSAIEQLAADPKLRLKLGSAGRDRIRQDYSWSTIAKQFLAVHRQALKESLQS